MAWLPHLHRIRLEYKDQLEPQTKCSHESLGLGLSRMAVFIYMNTFHILEKHMQLIIYTIPWFLFIVIDQKWEILYTRCVAYSRAALISIFEHLHVALIRGRRLIEKLRYVELGLFKIYVTESLRFLTHSTTLVTHRNERKYDPLAFLNSVVIDTPSNTYTILISRN